MLGTLGGTLAGCGVRWEDSAPDIPLVPVPTREPIPAEEALLWLLADSRDLSQRASTDASADVSTDAGNDTSIDADAALYREQTAVLRTALYRAGVPIETIDEVLATPPATLDPDPAAALGRVDDLAQCGGGLFPLIVSLLAQRWASVIGAGGQIPESALAADPARPWDLRFLAVPFAERTGAAEYGFEVAAAQSTDEQRDAAVAGLDVVRQLGGEQDKRSGGRAPDPQVGYLLPFPVNSEESAAQLATHVADGLISGYAGLLPTMVGSAQEETARDLVAWLGTAAVLGLEWDVPLTAFPGAVT